MKQNLSFWLVFATAACVLVAPLFTIDVLPIVDYPNHLARLYISSHGSSDPWLSHMYKQQWAIIPNLGIDLLVPWTLSFLPLYLAGRVMLALTLLLPVIGTIAYHSALFGGNSFWPLSSLIVAYKLVFLLGFHNLLLSYGIALLSAAIFYKTTRGSAIFNTVITAACAIVTFFTHIVGRALLIGILSVHKIFRIVESWPNWRRVGRAAFVHGCGFGIVVLGPLGLYLASPLAAAPIGDSWIGGIDKLKSSSELLSSTRFDHDGMFNSGFHCLYGIRAYYHSYQVCVLASLCSLPTRIYHLKPKQQRLSMCDLWYFWDSSYFVCLYREIFRDRL